VREFVPGAHAAALCVQVLEEREVGLHEHPDAFLITFRQVPTSTGPEVSTAVDTSACFGLRRAARKLSRASGVTHHSRPRNSNASSSPDAHHPTSQVTGLSASCSRGNPARSSVPEPPDAPRTTP
jgi:hypothetical protein